MKIYYWETASNGSFWVWRGDENDSDTFELVAYKAAETAPWKSASKLKKKTLVTLAELKHASTSLEQMSEEEVFLHLL